MKLTRKLPSLGRRKWPRDETTAQGSYAGLPRTDHRRAQRSIMAEEHNTQHSVVYVAENKLEQIKVKLAWIAQLVGALSFKIDNMEKMIALQKDVVLLVGGMSLKIEKMEKMIATEKSVAQLVGDLSAKIENMEKMIASERRSAQEKWEAKLAQDKLAQIAAFFGPRV